MSLPAAVLMCLQATTAADLHAFGPLAPVGDVDGDGVCDLLMGPRLHGGRRRLEGGDTWLVSGAHGKVLWRWPDEHARSPGAAVGGIGDVNGDGVPDLAIGAPGRANDRGLVRVYSGTDASLLWQVAESAPDSGFGRAIDATGDVDGDGVRDLAAGEPEIETVRVFSGRDGHELWTARRGASGGRFGAALSLARDVDGDGRADLLVGAPLERQIEVGPHCGVARLLSGRDGSVLHSWISSSPMLRFGDSVVLVDDLSGDGRPDAVVGASRIHPDPSSERDSGGRAFVYDGSSGAEILALRGDPYNGKGSFVTTVGDVDEDGRVDLVLCSPNGYPMQGPSGTVKVVSGNSGATLAEFGWPGELGGLAWSFPVAAAPLGDVNGDGVPDLAFTFDHYGPGERGLCVVSARGELVYAVGTGELTQFRALWPDWTSRRAVTEAEQRTFGHEAFVLGVEPGGPQLLVIGQPDRADVGGAWVVDLATERVVLNLPKREPGGRSPVGVRSTPDLDGDGREDIAQLWRGGEALWLCTLVSSRDGRPLAPPLEGELLGFHDVSGDRRPEVFLRGEPREFHWGNSDSRGRALWVPWYRLLNDLDDDLEVDYAVRAGGRVVVREHESWASWSWKAPSRERFALDGGPGLESIGVLDDVDGDGVRDLWVATHDDAVRVVSGTDGRELTVVDHARLPRSTEPNLDNGYPGNVAVVGDADGDGLRDLLVGAREPGGGLGSVGLFSSASGKLVRAFQGQRHQAEFGSSVARGADVNGDGVEDPVISAVAPQSDRTGCVYVIDGATGAVLMCFTRPDVEK